MACSRCAPFKGKASPDWKKQDSMALRAQEFMQQRLQTIQSRHLFRQVASLEQGATPWITVGDRQSLNLCSNNYLGLASHPRVKEAAIAAIRDYGCGTGASRLMTGTTALHAQLEQRLAAFKDCEQTLLFGSGYLANMGVITSLVGSGDVVLSDELNHASIIDGCRLSHAERRIYPHCDTAVLAEQLEALERVKHPGTRLVVTESVFSMDGDVAPLAEIAALCERYHALLIVDEAHATGCLGPGGRGLVAQLGQHTDAIIGVNTLSKAFGAIGAFVSSSSLVKDFLVNVTRQFIFTTALPPADVAASLAVLDLLQEDPELPARLLQKSSFFRSGLQRLGFQTQASETQIIPLLIGDSALALQMAHTLRERGLYAIAVRPPTVPMGTARLRFSIMASHTEEDLSYALGIIEKIGREMRLIG